MESIRDIYTVGDDGVFRHKSQDSQEPKTESVEATESKPDKETPATPETPETPVKEQEVVNETIESQEEIKEEASDESKPDQEKQEAPVEEEKEDDAPEVEGVKEERAPIDKEETKPVNSLSETDVLSFLSEKLGKDLNSLEDLTAGDNTDSKPKTDLDKALQDLKDWSLQSGLPLQDYFKYQKDYDSMSDLEKIEEHTRYKYPSLTDDQIKLEMENYIPDEDVDEERDIALKKLNQKKAAQEAGSVLSELKTQLSEYTHSTSLTEDQKSDIELAKDYKKFQQDSESNTQVYMNSVKEASTQIKSLPLKLDDDLTIEYNISDLGRSQIPDMAIKMPHWYNEDGSLKHSAVVKDTAKVKFFDEAVKTAYQQGISKGKEMLLDSSRNSTLGKPQQKTFENQIGSSKNKPIFENVSKEMAPFINSLNGNI